MDTYTKQKSWADRKKMRHAEQHRRKEEAVTKGLTFKPKLNTSKSRYKNIKSRLLTGTGLETSSVSYSDSLSNTNRNSYYGGKKNGRNNSSPQCNKFQYSKSPPGNTSYLNSQNNYMNTNNKRHMLNDSYDSPESNQSQQQENNNLNTNEASSNIPTNDTIDNNNKSNSNNIPSANNNVHTGAPLNINNKNDNTYDDQSSIAATLSSASYNEQVSTQSHIARQLEARRRKENIAKGIKFKVKKSALNAKPFNLSRSNLPFASKPVTSKTISSEQHLWDRIATLEKQIELLKIKQEKEKILIRNETLMKNEKALKDQAQVMIQKHQEERSNWHVERAKLLTLIDTLKDEVSYHRDVSQRKSDELSQSVTSTFENLSQHMLTIEKHSVEELRLLRAKVANRNSNTLLSPGKGNVSGSGSMSSSSVVDIETLRGLLRSLEKNIRRLMLGREESSGNQVAQLKKYLKTMQEATDEKQQKARNLDTTRHSKLMQQIHNLQEELTLQHHMTSSDQLPEDVSKINAAKTSNVVDQVVNIDFNDTNITNEGTEDLHMTNTNSSKDNNKNLGIQEESNNSGKLQAAKTGPKKDTTTMHVPNDAEIGDDTNDNDDYYKSDEFENDQDFNDDKQILSEENLNNKSFDSNEDGSQQSLDSSLDTWIEVNQPENKGGKFFYNRKTREVRKDKPADDE
jgi:hypothetical protein